MDVRVLHGDALELLPTLSGLDACVCDPPYHLTSIVKRFGSPNAAPLRNRDTETGRAGPFNHVSRGFMGKQWDGGDIALRPETWALVLQALKPGAHLLAFGGTRTFHRMACAIEDAGFEIRDTIMWVYGSGFPKSRNLAAAWSGWGTALKPAWEPIIVARRPLVGTVAGNVLKHGTGAINVDGCRVPTDETIHTTRNVALGSSGSGVYGAANVPGVFESHQAGRWPANLCHDGSDEVMALFPETESGSLTAEQQVNGGFKGALHCYGTAERGGANEYAASSGSAARFFYCAKADADDRAWSKHPTVKPLALMRWLVRLVTPPGGTVLDCFAGSGTTGEAARLEGFSAVLIEREAEYVADIRRRLGRASGDDMPLFA